MTCIDIIFTSCEGRIDVLNILLNKFVDVRVDRVGAGVYGGMTGRQKGAVAVSFKLKDATFLFVASHLSRNSHLNHDIERLMR